jgi:hypothetical protein
MKIHSKKEMVEGVADRNSEICEKGIEPGQLIQSISCNMK